MSFYFPPKDTKKKSSKRAARKRIQIKEETPVGRRMLKKKKYIWRDPRAGPRLKSRKSKPRVRKKVGFVPVVCGSCQFYGALGDLTPEIKRFKDRNCRCESIKEQKRRDKYMEIKFFSDSDEEEGDKK